MKTFLICLIFFMIGCASTPINYEKQCTGIVLASHPYCFSLKDGNLIDHGYLKALKNTEVVLLGIYGQDASNYFYMVVDKNSDTVFVSTSIVGNLRWKN